jgi:UDP-3-O-acyl N-acetylglucosamine deacetylase
LKSDPFAAHALAGRAGPQQWPMIPRRTLAAPVEVVGIGLFTGSHATLRIAPAEPGEGLTFRRAGAEAPIPGRIDALAAPPPGAPARNTSLAAAPGAAILTVEHLLSALVGLNITEALIEVDGPEIPIGDGSAALFVEAIARAGSRALEGMIEPLTIEREVSVESGGSRITARPRTAPGCRYTYELDYGPGPIGAQSAAYETDWSGAGAERYAAEVAPARTFCLQAEAEAMRALGLFTSLTPRDMLVFGADGPIDNALRFANEPARHKLLDLIGDLALVGRPLQMEITAVRAGHALNHAMARALLEAGT